MTTTTDIRTPRGILAHYDPSLRRRDLHEKYRCPTVDELRAMKGFRQGVGNRWRPVPHGDYADALVEACEHFGLDVQSECYSLEGHTLRGYFEIGNRGTGSVYSPDRTVGVLGFVADNSQRSARTVALGEQVYICTNGCVFAEHVVRRKSTTGLDYKDLARQAVRLWVQDYDKNQEVVHKLKSKEVYGDYARNVMADAVGLGATPAFLSIGHARDILEEYKNPTHEVFRSRTAWSLYNAATQTFKTRRVSNAKAMQIQLGMARLLVPELN